MIEAFPGAWKTHKDKNLISNLEEAAAVSFSSAILKESRTHTRWNDWTNHTEELLGVGLRGLTHVQAHGLACPWADLAHRGVVMGGKR